MTGKLQITYTQAVKCQGCGAWKDLQKPGPINHKPLCRYDPASYEPGVLSRAHAVISCMVRGHHCGQGPYPKPNGCPCSCHQPPPVQPDA